MFFVKRWREGKKYLHFVEGYAILCSHEKRKWRFCRSETRFMQNLPTIYMVKPIRTGGVAAGSGVSRGMRKPHHTPDGYSVLWLTGETLLHY